MSEIAVSTSKWDAADYARVGAFVAELGAAALDLLDPQPGEHILDVGCGEGTLTKKIVERGATVLGIDNSPEMVEAAKAKGLDALVMDVAEMRFQAEFDAAFSNATLHWVLDKERAAAAIYTALHSGGRFAGELGGDGNLARLREALDTELVIRGYVPPLKIVQLVPNDGGVRRCLCHCRVRAYRRPADRAADPAGARRRLVGDDFPPRVARSCRSADRRMGRDRIRRRRPRRLERRRLRPPPLHHEKARLMRYLPLSDADRSEMLRVIGAGAIDELFRDVPEELRLKGPIEGLPLHQSELAVERHMTGLSRKNMVAGEVPFFLGCGAYRHHVPASVDHIIQRGEFLTSYTPYQPEIAQGTLQMMFEFQTQVARLYGCEVANASMYDGSTAMWEAILMAHRVTRRNRTVISSGVHPHYVSVATTMAKFTGDALDTALPELTAETDAERLIAAIGPETSAVVVQYPDILGRITDLAPIAEAAHAAGALLIAVVTEPVALGLISRRARWAPTSSSAKARASASACSSAVPMSACSPAARSTCGRCRGVSPARLSTPRASAALC